MEKITGSYRRQNKKPNISGKIQLEEVQKELVPDLQTEAKPVPIPNTEVASKKNLEARLDNLLQAGDRVSEIDILKINHEISCSDRPSEKRTLPSEKNMPCAKRYKSGVDVTENLGQTRDDRCKVNMAPSSDINKTSGDTGSKLPEASEGVADPEPPIETLIEVKFRGSKPIFDSPAAASRLARQICPHGVFVGSPEHLAETKAYDRLSVSFTKAIAEANRLVSNYETRLKSLRLSSPNSKMQQRLNTLEDSLEIVSLDDLKAKIRTRDEIINRLTQSCSDLRKGKKVAKNKMTEVSSENYRLQVELNSLTETHKEDTETIKRLNAKMKDIQRTFDSSVAKYGKRIAYMEEIKQTQHFLSQCEGNIIFAEEIQSGEIPDMEAELKKMRKDAERLRAELAEKVLPDRSSPSPHGLSDRDFRYCPS